MNLVWYLVTNLHVGCKIKSKFVIQDGIAVLQFAWMLL